MTVATCTGTGACLPSEAPVAISLQPIETGPGGAGSYRIEIGGSVVTATATSEFGPYSWPSGETSTDALLVSGPNELLWHHLDLAAGPAARIDFLHCEDPR